MRSLQSTEVCFLWFHQSGMAAVSVRIRELAVSREAAELVAVELKHGSVLSMSCFKATSFGPLRLYHACEVRVHSIQLLRLYNACTARMRSLQSTEVRFLRLHQSGMVAVSVHIRAAAVSIREAAELVAVGLKNGSVLDMSRLKAADLGPLRHACEARVPSIQLRRLYNA